MNNLTKRLNAIAYFIEIEDKIVDVGCDHAYLSIYLIKNKLCQSAIATDINKNALSNAIKNIEESKLNIPTVLSDGIENIDTDKINTIVISGMGTSTILHILKDDNKLKNIKKMVLQSNNDHELLRKSLNDKGYYLEEENYTYESGKWYITMKFIKKDKQNTKEEQEFGYLNNKEYIIYLTDSLNDIVSKIPDTSKDDREYYINKLNRLKTYSK